VKKRYLFTIPLLALISVGFSDQIALGAQPTSIGSVGIRIAQIPADVANNPYSKAYIVSRVYPGVALTQRLEVFNTSSQEFKVSLYPGKATLSGGNFEVADGRTGNDLTSWVKLTPSTVTVKSGQSQYFDVTILPPMGAPSIQQFGVIWAEVQGDKNAAGITAVSRVGIRMYVPVGDSAAIAIGGTSMTSSTNEILVKKSILTAHEIELLVLFVSMSIVFLFLFLFFFRRGSSDHKFRKENEKILESQWKRERDRRREIWKRRGRSNPQREQRPQRPQLRSYDEYDDEDR
jgi:hypothetical protein